MFVDLEVNNNPYYGAIASPRHEDNYVVMIGQAIDYNAPYEGEVTHLHFKSKEEAKDWLKIPDDVGLLVAHNLSFEMDWIYEQCYEEIKKFINRGGKFWCTQLAEYRLTRQQHLYPSLEETAMKYGGNAKLDLVAVEWKLGKLTSEIDTGLLKDYLVGTPEMEGDIGNTRLAFYGQWVQATDRGMVKAILEQNNALIFNSVCMSNGLKIDKDVAVKNLARLNDRISEVETLLEEARIQAGISIEGSKAFKMGSDFHKSAWIYGGAYRYDAKVPSIDKDGNFRYEKVDAVKDAVLGGFVEVNTDIQHVLESRFNSKNYEYFTPTRYKSGKRKGEIKVERIDSDEIKMVNGKVEENIEGIINLNDYPQEFLESWLSTYTQSRELADGSDVYSTSEDAITELANRKETSKEAKEVLLLLREWAILNKVIGSFFDRQEFYAKGNPKKRSGMFQFITDDSLIHHSLNMSATKTGRLSSTKPNLQQIPRDDREGVMQSNIKEMFVSRFGEQGRIVEIDFNALEVRAMADFAGDTALQKAILDGTDMHSLRASEYHGWSYEEFNTRRKDPEDPMYDQLNQWRQDIKPKSFAYQYGATAHGISFATGCTVAEAEKFIANEQKSFPDVEGYFTGVAEQVETTRKMRRVRLEDGTYDIYFEGHLKAPSGYEYAYRTYKKAQWVQGQKMEVDEFKPTEMRNYIVQGDSSLFVQVVTGKLIRHYFSVDFYDRKCYPINTVHDQVLLDVHVDVLEQVIRETVDIMEDIPKWMSNLGYNLTMPYPVEATVGMNWQDQKPLSEVGINLEGVKDE